MLTSYDGNTITYDTIGNPLTDGTWTYTWQNGRELASMTDGATTWTYTYDANGLRKTRSNGTDTYTYVYNGSQLVQMTRGTDVLYFDHATGTVTWNGVTYYYVYNLQGDVIAILDSAGTAVVNYVYDAWGNLVDTSGYTTHPLGTLNPLTYRAYTYDHETGLYYLQSRYYSPEIGRFINADMLVANAGGELLGNNMFAYCFNNPVNMVDSAGNWAEWVTIALGIAAAAAAVAITVATLGAAAPAAVCTLTMMATTSGLSYGVASALATTVVVATSTAATTYAADVAYSSVTGQSPLKDTIFQGNEEAYNVGLAITSMATGNMLQAAAMSPGVCFVAGTEILTANGLQAIETVQVGDYVWAWDEATGDAALKEVVETYINETDELIHVFVNGVEIVTTPAHPFYSPVKGWMEACKLRAGDMLVLVNGEYVVVEKVQHEILEAPITVYNFQVADYHTYYVSSTGVLVHNSCNHGSSWGTERQRYWKNAAQSAVLGKDYGAYVATADNISRMTRGLAPIGWDGYSVQLHHWSGIVNDFYDYSPLSRTLHILVHKMK